MPDQKELNKNEDKLFFSVLIPVYKGTSCDYFNEAMKSIQLQTYQSFEVVLVVDGPLTQKHYESIKNWESVFGERLNILTITNNVGLAKALNWGIKGCSSEWIARMDADDVMRHDRLMIQREFIKKNPNVSVVGSWLEEYDETMMNSKGVREVPIAHKDIVRFGKWRSPINHVTVCYQKDAILKIDGYNEKLRRSQDYALWANFIVNGYNLANIPQCLVKVRAGDDFFANRNTIKVIKYDIRQRLYMKKIGFLNTFEFSVSLLFRIMIRVLPIYFVKRIYAHLRSS